ncbi:MAG: 50S ribosomal protein L22 [Actinomycetota bacterium]
MAKAAVQTYKAGAKFIRISPYKVREVAAIIKGKHVDEARRILAFTPKAASFEMSKILESAIANAEHNFQVPQEELYVRFVSADEGVTIKRFRPRAQGRGFRIRKRTSHIQLELERRVGEIVEKPRRSAAKPAAKGATKPATPKGGSKEDATDKGSAQSKGGAKPKPEPKAKVKSAEEKPGAAKAKATPSEKKAAGTQKKAPAKTSTKTTKEGN